MWGGCFTVLILEGVGQSANASHPSIPQKSQLRRQAAIRVKRKAISEAATDDTDDPNHIRTKAKLAREASRCA